MSSRSLRAATVLVAFLMAGCHQLQNDYNDWVTTRAVNSEAFWAWKAYHPSYKGEVYYIYDFGAGFRAGYAQVLSGGDPCPPTLPPEKYWYIKYQNQQGRERIEAWFSGHESGVAAAYQDGVQDGNKIPLSPYRRAQLGGRGGSCPTCFPPGQTAPAYDYETVPPMPAPDAPAGEMPEGVLEPLTEEQMEETAAPVSYLSDEVIDQE